MRSWLTTILVTIPLALPGCRTHGTVTPIVGEGPGSTGGGDPIATNPTQPAYYTAPAHVFTPRPHPAHTRPMPPPPPDPRSLPKLVDRTAQCYGAPRPEPRPVTKKSGGTIAKSGSGSGSGYGRGSGKGGGGYKNVPYQPAPASTSPSKPTEAKPAAKKDSGGSAGGLVGSTGSSLGPVASADAAPGMAPPPEAQAKSAEVAVDTSRASSRDEKRRAKKEKKASKRADRPAAASPAAEEAAAYEPAGADYDDVAEDERLQPGAQLVARDDVYDQYTDWGQATYLSNDDTMSLSSAQRILYAIDRYLPLPPEHIRPHELLNYFSFNTIPVAETDDFSVLAEIAQNPDKEGIYDLALAVQGKPMDRQTRRNANLTLVIDRSGSMSDEGRMSYLKQGLKRMTSELKDGDVVNMVIFDHDVCTPLENFVVGRDRPAILSQAIDGLKPRGSTDLYSGLAQGYQLADRSYQPTYNNRVMLITDALANTGVTDTRAIAMVGKYYDERRIRLSGVGVGSTFNDELLDRLTEKGKGAYVFLGSEAEVDAVFGPRLVSLLETTALDVHFQLHLPPSLRMNVFYGEEASTVKEEVQAIHYFANTSQLFFSELMARGGKLRPEDWIMMTIEYEDPETGAATMEEVAWNLGDIAHESANVNKARLLMGFVQRLGELAYRPAPSGYRTWAGGWNDQGAWQICEEGRQALDRMAAPLAGDSEVNRVRGLWAKYCSRYDRPQQPVQAQPVQAQPDRWPGASGS